MRRAGFIFHPESVGQMSEVDNIRRCKHAFLACKNGQILFVDLINLVM